MYRGKSIRVELLADGIAELCFDRDGESVNKFDCRTVDELAAATAAIRGAPGLRGVLVTSAKGVFIAGADIFEFAGIFAGSEAGVLAHITGQNAAFTGFDDLPVPSVAAVNGFALGGGLEMALACDIVIAAEHAVFALSEPRVGVAALAGGVHRLARQIGLKQAMGMLLNGRKVSAAEAHELGFVNEVVPAAELMATAQRWAAEIAACAPLAVRATKQLAMSGLDLPLREAMAASYPMVTAMLNSPDMVEGARAFAERRAPNWQG